ncbi:carboxylate-amine ligase [Gulosibacter chungangensis]|uniref:Putative glutamate--cysteine ligase 2 n=1 Tax=Gulosibacter chungangensis TaxID=979746 RepID=A0A7J5BA58_9MICO|nr:YbdK family carboxylate-amine ligase [Gulosibacter chungangensis]KAB1642648.1 YbdK family carboxylate-amine ligase [Gulosibacter chungangensis]
MDFAPTERTTIGIEWELALVDPASGDLTGRANEIIAEVADPRCVGEFLTNTVELVTKVHHNVHGAIEDLRELRGRLTAAAAQSGVAAIGVGTHPFADWKLQTVTPAERYLRVTDRSRDWGRQLSIWGVHVHVGIPERDHVIPTMHAVLANVQWLLALSVSSPYWDGHDTGWASHRTMLFQQLPTGGLPPGLETWADYERTLEGMLKGEVVLDPLELRWDVRPAPQFGTLEVRIADGLPSLFDVGANAAFTQCVVEESMRALEEGRQPMRLPDWAVRENKFRAARWGFDTKFITSADGAQESGRESLARRIDELMPIAEDLGCEGELVAALAIVDNTPADRMRAALRTGGKVGVIDSLRAEFLR